MIVFDLECARGHSFEGWFESAEAFDTQKAEKLVSCPACSSKDVRRVMSPVAESLATTVRIWVPAFGAVLASNLMNTLAAALPSVTWTVPSDS